MAGALLFVCGSLSPRMQTMSNASGTHQWWVTHPQSGHCGGWAMDNGLPVNAKLRAFIFRCLGVMPRACSRQPGQGKKMWVTGCATRLSEAYWVTVEVARHWNQWDIAFDNMWAGNVRCGVPEDVTHRGLCRPWTIQFTQPHLKNREWVRGPEGGWVLSRGDWMAESWHTPIWRPTQEELVATRAPIASVNGYPMLVSKGCLLYTSPSPRD